MKDIAENEKPIPQAAVEAMDALIKYLQAEDALGQEGLLLDELRGGAAIIADKCQLAKKEAALRKAAAIPCAEDKAVDSLEILVAAEKARRAACAAWVRTPLPKQRGA